MIFFYFVAQFKYYYPRQPKRRLNIKKDSFWNAFISRTTEKKVLVHGRPHVHGKCHNRNGKKDTISFKIADGNDRINGHTILLWCCHNPYMMTLPYKLSCKLVTLSYNLDSIICCAIYRVCIKTYTGSS